LELEKLKGCKNKITNFLNKLTKEIRNENKVIVPINKTKG